MIQFKLSNKEVCDLFQTQVETLEETIRETEADTDLPKNLKMTEDRKRRAVVLRQMISAIQADGREYEVTPMEYIQLFD